MDVDYLRFLIVLVLVLGLIFGCAYLARRMGFGGLAAAAQRNRWRQQPRRIDVVEIAALDARRRLALIRRDDTEHLLLLGHDRDIVIETGIPAAARSEPLPEAAPPGPPQPGHPAIRRFAAVLAGKQRTTPEC